MKIATIIIGLILIALCSRAQQKPTARAYYEGLYKAGQLDRLADAYVCEFDTHGTDDTNTFFTFGESTRIRDRLKQIGEFDGLSKQDHELLNQDVAIFRFYTKEVPGAERLVMAKNTEGRTSNVGSEGWATEPRDLNDKGDKTRAIFSIDLRTLHFYYGWQTTNAPPFSDGHLAKGVEDLPMSPSLVGNFGKCKHIPTRIQQHGL